MKKHLLVPKCYASEVYILGGFGGLVFIFLILKFVTLAFEQGWELLFIPMFLLAWVVVIFVVGWDMFSKFSARVSFNQSGTTCSHVFSKPDYMAWDTIKIYGTHSSDTNLFYEKYVFFSSESDPKALRFRDPLKLTKTHFAICASSDMLDDLYTCMPMEMKKRITMGIEKNWDMCWQRNGQVEKRITNCFYNPIAGLSTLRRRNNFELMGLMDKNWKEYKKRNKME